MIEIRGLYEDTLWDVVNFCYPHPEREREYATGDSARFAEDVIRDRLRQEQARLRGGRVQWD